MTGLPKTRPADFRVIVAIRDRTVRAARARGETVLPPNRSRIVWMLQDMHDRFRLDLTALAEATDSDLLADSYAPLAHWDSLTGRFADDWTPRHVKKRRRRRQAAPVASLIT